MNYDDPSQQQQQFYMQQRMQSQPQQQRMAVPMAQQHNQLSSMQQQAMRQLPYGMMHPHQQVMVRMPPTMGDDSAAHHQQQIRDIIQTFPPGIQSQINSENNPERKKQMFQAAFKQQQMFEQQMQGGMRIPMNVSPQRMPMAQTSGIVYPGQQIMMQQTGPAQIQRIPSQGSFGPSPGQPSQQMPPQMYLANQMGQSRPLPMQPMPINQPPYAVQQHQFPQQQQHPHQIAAGQPQPPMQQMLKQPAVPIATNVHQQPPQKEPQNSGTTTGTIGHGQMRKAASSQILQQVHPGGQPHSNEAEAIRAQNTPDLQPRSAGTPLSQQQNETENPEYKALLEKLRTYHADVKRILDRLNIDNPGETKLKSSLINVLQVMEGTRKGGSITKDLLRKLLSNVQTVLDQYSISRHLANAAKKLSTMSANARETIAKESLFIDPWREVRHLQIKLPEANLLGVVAGGQPRRCENGAAKFEDANGPPSSLKRTSLLTTMTESFSPAKKVRTIANESDSQHKVKCMDGSDLVLNSVLSLALDEAAKDGFALKFDIDQAPISSTNTSTVNVRLVFHPQKDSDKEGLGGGEEPLDLLLPTDYPKSAIQILPCFSSASENAWDNLMERIDSEMVDNHSLEDILQAWKKCLVKC